ncbi:RluA family pseudouridine synthase [Zunongwangia sp. F260]|uniref:RluA family pseudouridine synthase n=1 Tax=Autumnicola lenta TaxID=3075593 RepID=A0ABU3CL02_9FLAO|nr:RluA family pseudouridine synthase [Zunongwangia sp. F260]MDT0647027.1 RluA family pseudouridine synthase [Zunongwangia sp. F260]
MKIIETHIVPAIDDKIRLQEYAVSIFETIPSRSGIKKAIKRKEILLDGKPASTSDWITEGQKIELLQAENGKKKTFTLKLEVLYEDEDLAIIDKPSGIPTSGNYFKTVENALPFNLQISAKKSALPAPLPAHRLDNPTSGVLICAKTRPVLIKIQEMFQKKEIQKTYLACTTGRAPKMAIFDSQIEDKPAVTRIEVQEYFRIDNLEYSLLKVFPETGRTHQIRIHLSQNGLPIVGDRQYGGEIQQKFKGLYLAAIGIKLKHPVNEKMLVVELPLPKKFLKIETLAQTP